MTIDSNQPDDGATQPLLIVQVILPVVVTNHGTINEPEKPTWGTAPVSGTPIYGSDAPSQLQKKFVKQGAKDVWAGVLFGLVLLATVITAGVLGSTYNSQILESCAYDGGSSSNGGMMYSNAKNRRGQQRAFGAQQFFGSSGSGSLPTDTIEATQAGSGSGATTQATSESGVTKQAGSGSGFTTQEPDNSGSWFGSASGHGGSIYTTEGAGSGSDYTTQGAGSGSGFTSQAGSGSEYTSQGAGSGSGFTSQAGSGSDFTSQAGSGSEYTSQGAGSGSGFTSQAGSGSEYTSQGAGSGSEYTSQGAGSGSGFTSQAGSGSGDVPATGAPWQPFPDPNAPAEAGSVGGSSSLALAPCSFFSIAPAFMGASVGAAIWMATASIALMRLAPRVYIVAANALLIALFITGGSFELGYGMIPNGVVLLLMGLFHALWFALVRRRIPFAAALLGQSVRTVSMNWGSFLTSFAALFVLAAYCSAWFFAAIPAMTLVAANTNTTLTVFTIGGFLLIFFWSTQVLINVVHVTASGGVATWYFAGGASMPSKPSLAALKRAMTTSFGSICLGSLIVAILKLIHAILRGSTRQLNCLSCISMCLIVLIERLMQWFNVYAFTHVAIYGSSYTQAAKQTWDMIENFGWAAIFNDSLIFPVLSITTLLNSIAIGYTAFRLENATAPAFVLGLICGTIAYVIHVVLFRVVYSGVVTIFVCYCECPEALAVSNPEFNAKVEEAIEPLRAARIAV